MVINNICYIFFIVNNLNVYICVYLHAVVECIVCCLMTIQPLDFKSIKSYLILINKLIAFQLSDLWRCSVILNCIYCFHLATNWYTIAWSHSRSNYITNSEYRITYCSCLGHQCKCKLRQLRPGHCESLISCVDRTQIYIFLNCRCGSMNITGILNPIKHAI
jgi:hypothetical protein